MRVLFVCLGNICRSPSAEAVLRAQLESAGLADRIEVDSAGTGSWHIGSAPDRRAIAVGRRRGYALSNLKARQLQPGDLRSFDLVLDMDRDNLQDIKAIASPDASADIDLFLGRYGIGDGQVPDPYYGDECDFERVFDLVEQGCQALLNEL